MEGGDSDECMAVPMEGENAFNLILNRTIIH